MPLVFALQQDQPADCRLRLDGTLECLGKLSQTAKDVAEGGGRAVGRILVAEKFWQEMDREDSIPTGRWAARKGHEGG